MEILISDLIHTKVTGQLLYIESNINNHDKSIVFKEKITGRLIEIHLKFKDVFDYKRNLLDELN